MGTLQETEEKKVFASGRITMLVGFLMVLFTCIYFTIAIALDIGGEKAIGKLSNVSKGCSPNKSCWTSKIEFTTKAGEQAGFYPLTSPIFFDVDNAISGKPYEEYNYYEVRYFESYPQLAKVKLVFHLEKIGKFGWLFLGLVLMIFGRLFSRPNNKPFVLDLRHLRKKNK